MRPALQLVIQINDFMQPVIDYVHEYGNVSLIQFSQDETHFRVIYDATEEQQAELDDVLKEMINKLNANTNQV